MHVRLESMRAEHAEGLVAAATGHGLFRYFPFSLESEAEMCAFVASSVAARDRRPLDRAVVSAQPSEQRGEASAAVALLRVARLQLRRVQYRVEGTFRAHMVMRDGALRGSVYYSVVASEWPGLKQRIMRMCARV